MRKGAESQSGESVHQHSLGHLPGCYVTHVLPSLSPWSLRPGGEYTFLGDPTGIGGEYRHCGMLLDGHFPVHVHGE